MRLEMILQPVHRLGVGIGPVIELEQPLRAFDAADEPL